MIGDMLTMILSRIFQILWADVDGEALQPRINQP